MVEWTDVAPNRLLLTSMGERYYEVMGLQDIPKEDVKEVAKHLIQAAPLDDTVQETVSLRQSSAYRELALDGNHRTENLHNSPFRAIFLIGALI